MATTRNSVVLLAETGGSGAKRLLRSADVGASWAEVQGARGPVAAPPDEPGTVYALSTPGTLLMKSTDNGRIFRPTGGALPVAAGDEVRTLHATYGRPAALFVSLRAGGLFRSGNGGGSFHRVGFRNEGPSALASEPGNPRKVYAGNAVGLYSSDFGGMGGTFRTLAALSLNSIPEPAALAAAPLSTDGGATFNRVGSPLSSSPFPEAADLVFDPAEPRRRLIAMNAGIVLLHEPGEAGLGRVVRSGPEIDGRDRRGRNLLGGWLERNLDQRGRRRQLGDRPRRQLSIGP